MGVEAWSINLRSTNCRLLGLFSSFVCYFYGTILGHPCFRENALKFIICGLATSLFLFLCSPPFNCHCGFVSHLSSATWRGRVLTSRNLPFVLSLISELFYMCIVSPLHRLDLVLCCICSYANSFPFSHRIVLIVSRSAFLGQVCVCVSPDTVRYSLSSLPLLSCINSVLSQEPHIISVFILCLLASSSVIISLTRSQPSIKVEPERV